MSYKPLVRSRAYSSGKTIEKRYSDPLRKLEKTYHERSVAPKRLFSPLRVQANLSVSAFVIRLCTSFGSIYTLSGCQSVTYFKHSADVQSTQFPIFYSIPFLSSGHPRSHRLLLALFQAHRLEVYLLFKQVTVVFQVLSISALLKLV